MCIRDSHMIVDPVSNTRQMPRPVKSDRFPGHSIICLVYGSLSPSGMTFLHISTHDFWNACRAFSHVVHKMSRHTQLVYARLIIILLVINLGYFLMSFLPHAIVQEGFPPNCRNPQLASHNVRDVHWKCRLQRDCPVATHSRSIFCLIMSGYLSACLRYYSRSSVCHVVLFVLSYTSKYGWTNDYRRKAHRHWKFICRLDVWLPLSPVPMILMVDGVRVLSSPKLGSGVYTMSPQPTRLLN